jgi:hypothetical protein
MDTQTFRDREMNTLLLSLAQNSAQNLAQNSAPDGQLQDGHPEPPLSRPHSEQQIDWNAVVVLEQCPGFCLIQEKSTQLYYLCDSDQRPLLQTAQWAEAYRSWLNYRHRFPEVPVSAAPVSETLSREALHDWVSQHQDNPSFGQLLYSCDRQFQGTLTYLVRLSETAAICWAPTTGQTVSLGRLTVETLGQRRHRSAKWIESRSSACVADALHRSIRGLHQRCQYSLYQFNSEHWARLMTTGQGCCFQKDDLYAYWLNRLQPSDPHTPPDIWEENLEAQVLLLMAIAP